MRCTTEFITLIHTFIYLFVMIFINHGCCITITGEIVAEFGQQDREYTVDYSAVSRVSARITPPPHSPSYTTPSRPHTLPNALPLPQNTPYPSEASREYHNGRHSRDTARDPESVSDNERPVPKPR